MSEIVRDNYVLYCGDDVEFKLYWLYIIRYQRYHHNQHQHSRQMADIALTSENPAGDTGFDDYIQPSDYAHSDGKLDMGIAITC